MPVGCASVVRTPKFEAETPRTSVWTRTASGATSGVEEASGKRPRLHMPTIPRAGRHSPFVINVESEWTRELRTALVLGAGIQGVCAAFRPAEPRLPGHPRRQAEGSRRVPAARNEASPPRFRLRQRR